MASAGALSATDLVRELCSASSGLSEGQSLERLHQYALKLLSSFSGSSSSEIATIEKLHSYLIKQGKDTLCVQVSDRINRIKQKAVLQNVNSVILLLLTLSEERNAKVGKSENLFQRGFAAQSTPMSGTENKTSETTGPHWAGQTVATAPHHALSSSASSSAFHGSSGLSSIYSSSRRTTPAHHTKFDPGLTQKALLSSLPPQSASVLGSMSRSIPPGSVRDLMPDRSRMYGSAQGKRPGGAVSSKPHLSSKERVSNAMLTRVGLYAIQGIESDLIKWTNDGLRLIPRTDMTVAQTKLLHRLIETGWLCSHITSYVNGHIQDNTFGQVGQSFCSALHQKLMEYYQLVALLESQLQREEGEVGDPVGESVMSPPSDSLTLHRLEVRLYEPRIYLKALASLVDACKDKKGGALASVVHSYLQHGDPLRSAMTGHILRLLVQPLFDVVLRWIFDGQLNDPYHEFFVAADPTVRDEALWHEKYSLRKPMIPSFISSDQAKKILLIGKSINFLRQVCRDQTRLDLQRILKQAGVHQVSPSSMFTQDVDGVFGRMIDTVYRQTSKHLLSVLNDKYRFIDHLKAMRRYLLLGQGDFIRHLMDLLEEDLAKPAHTLFLHTLSGLLETAVRATNAQFEEADILKRLDVRLLEASSGDQGWDVFSLDYHVDGPIGTVFTPDCVLVYLRVFNFLWRAKRMEYTLAGVWRQQTFHRKLLSSMSDVRPVLHQADVVSCKMIHFIQQMGYYLNFEVLECSWDELLTQVHQALDLDQTIAAHRKFLDTVTGRCLLNKASKEIFTELRAIFDLIVRFQAFLSNLFMVSGEEHHLRQMFQKKQKERQNEGEWGVTEGDIIVENERKAEFVQMKLKPARGQLKILGLSYHDMVVRFLKMLHSHPDASLRFLCFRLDFNEYYGESDPTLKRSPTKGASAAVGRTGFNFTTPAH